MFQEEPKGCEKSEWLSEENDEVEEDEKGEDEENAFWSYVLVANLRAYTVGRFEDITKRRIAATTAKPNKDVSNRNTNMPLPKLSQMQ